jgi:hypothetical protein
MKEAVMQWKTKNAKPVTRRKFTNDLAMLVSEVIAQIGI